MRTAGLAYLVATASTLALLGVTVALQSLAATVRRRSEPPRRRTTASAG